MIQTDSSSSDPVFFSDVEQDELFEENIDAFDEVMDNEYDDGIAHSHVEDHYEEDIDEEADDEDNISPIDADSDGELKDYDELED